MTPLSRNKDNPWQLKTPPGTSEYMMHVEEKGGTQVIVCTVGKTVLHYDARCVADLLHAMLQQVGDWVELGGADEQKSARVPAWLGRSCASLNLVPVRGASQRLTAAFGRRQAGAEPDPVHSPSRSRLP